MRSICNLRCVIIATRVRSTVARYRSARDNAAPRGWNRDVNQAIDTSRVKPPNWFAGALRRHPRIRRELWLLVAGVVLGFIVMPLAVYLVGVLTARSLHGWRARLVHRRLLSRALSRLAAGLGRRAWPVSVWCSSCDC